MKSAGTKEMGVIILADTMLTLRNLGPTTALDELGLRSTPSGARNGYVQLPCFRYPRRWG